MADPTDDTSSGPVTSPDATAPTPSTGTDLANILTGRTNDPSMFGGSARSDDTGQLLSPSGAAPQTGTDAAGNPLQSAAVKTSRSGLPGGAKRAGDLFSQADQQADADAAPYIAQTNKESSALVGDYASESDAVKRQGDQTRDFYAKQAELIHRQDDFYQTQAKLEQHASADADAQAKQHLALYQTQLAGVRQMMMTTGDPLGQLSFGQASGLGFAQFAQGFLAARGINIDVSGQVDRWVNRAIAEHQQQITNFRESANDTLHLYELARQTSADEYEARQRYRGFVVEGLKSSVEANAALFNSNIATTQAQAQSARLDIEQQKTQSDLYDRQRNEVFKLHQLRITEASDRGRLELEKEANSLKWAELAQKKATAKAQPLTPYFTDTSQTKIDPDTGKVISGGKVRAVVNDKAPGAAETMKSLGEAVAYKSAADNGVNMLQKLRTDKDFGSWINKTSSPQYRDFDAARTELGRLLQNMRDGKRINDKDYERSMAALQDDKAWQSGGNAGLMQNLKDIASVGYRAEYNRALSTGVLAEINPDQIDQRQGADKEGFMPYRPDVDPAGRADMTVHTDGQAPVATSIGGSVELAESKRGTGSVQPPTRLWQAVTGGQSKEVYDSRLSSVDWLAKMASDPAGYRRVHDEAAKNLNEDGKASATIPDDDKRLTKEAITGLKGIAESKDAPPTVSKYAKAVLHMYETDPDSLRDLAGVKMETETPDPYAGTARRKIVPAFADRVATPADIDESVSKVVNPEWDPNAGTSESPLERLERERKE